MTGIYEGWTAVDVSNSGTGEQSSPVAMPSRNPSGDQPAPVLPELPWDWRGSYPTMAPPNGVGRICDYSEIPEQR